MATDFNTVILIGRLTRDPEFKIISGTSLVNFSIANNRSFVASGVKKEETHFFDCFAWGKLADILKEYASKGKQIQVSGRLVQETWDTSDGKKASKIRIRVENFQFLGTRSETAVPTTLPPSPNPIPQPQSEQGENDLEDVDVEDIF